MITVLIATLLIVSFTQVLSAQEPKKAYVSDILILAVRTGPARNFEVVKTIESNAPLFILEEQGGFAKIKLANGDIGWVQAQYLTYDTPDPIIIKRLNRDLGKFKNQNNKQLKSIETLTQKNSHDLITLKNEKKELERILSETLKEKSDFVNKYTLIDKKHKELLESSKNIVATRNENEKLKKSNMELSGKVDELQSKNKTMLKIGMIKWFLAGAGVIFLGWLIGRSVSLKGSRRSGLLK